MANKLRIDTQINTQGAQADLQKLDSTVARFAASVLGSFKNLDKAIGPSKSTRADELSQKLIRQRASIEKQAIAIKDLEARLSKLGSPGFQSKDYKALQTELSKSRQEAVDLANSLKMVQNNIALERGKIRAEKIPPGLSEPTASQKNFASLLRQQEELQSQIKKTESYVISLQKQMHNVRTDPKSTEEYKSLRRQIDLAKLQMKSLKASAKETEIQIDRTLGRERNQTTKSMRAAGRATKKTSKEAKEQAGLFQNLTDKVDKFHKRIVRLGVTAFVFYQLRRVLRQLADWIYKTIGANDALRKSLGQIKGNLLTAFAPIYQAILPALNALMQALAKITAFIAQLMSLFFGKSIGAMKEQGKALDKLAGGYGGAGKAAKEAKKELASFDQIEVLEVPEVDSGGGGGGGGIEWEEFEIPDSLQAAYDKILEWLQRVWEYAEPTRKAMKRLWKVLKDIAKIGWQNAINFYNSFLKPVGKWVLGEGLPRLLNVLSDMLESIDWNRLLEYFNNLYKALAPFAIKIGEGLVSFWERFLVPLGGWVISDLLPNFLERLTRIITRLTNEIDFDALITNFEGLMNTFTSDFAASEGWSWFLDNFLVDIAVWAVNEALPTFIDLLSAAMSFLNTVLYALQPLWENVLKPLGMWAGETLIASLGWLVDVLTRFSDWIKENNDWVIAITSTILLFGTAWVTVTTAIKAYNAAVSLVSAAMALLTNPIALVIAAIALLVVGIIYLIQNWDKVKETGVKAWQGIKNAWNSVASWFNTNVIEPLSEWWSGFWSDLTEWYETTKTNLETTWETISGWFNDTVITPLSEWWNNFWEDLTAKYKEVKESLENTWKDVSTWFSTTVITPLSNFWETHWDDNASWGENAWNLIKGVWETVTSWFDDTIITPLNTAWDNAWIAITGFFTGAWTSIKETWNTVVSWFQTNIITPLENIFNTVADTIKSAINGVIGFVNKMIGGVETGVNWVVDAINSIGFDIPPVVVFGKTVFDGASVRPNVPQVSFARIPELAKGAVIPPNSEFLALLGDQRAGRNIETPEALLRQIVREELATQDVTTQAPITINFEGSMSELIRILRPVIRQEDNRVGRVMIAGGEYS